MATSDPDFLRGSERNARALILSVIGAFVLTAALGSKNTRAVFITDGGGKAFAATVAPDDAFSLIAPLRRRIANILSDLGSGDRPGDNVFVYSPEGGAVSPPRGDAGGLGIPAAPSANDVAAPPADASSEGLPGDAVNPGSPSAAGPPIGPIGAPPNAVPGSPPSTPTVPPVSPPVTAVPEPATWGMLLLGFLAIGTAARRRTSGAPIPGAVAF